MASRTNYNVDYSSLESFDTSRRSVLDMLKKFYPSDWKNFESGKAGAQIIDAFSFIGEVLQFTQGQYFNNSFPQTATNRQKAANLAQWYGMKNIGATLPWVAVTFTVSVSAVGGAIPTNQIPKILPGATLFAGDHSTPNFTLSNTVDFTKVPSEQWTKYYNTDGTLKRAEISAFGFCTAFTTNTINHTVSTTNGSTFQKFYEIELNKPNVQQIIEIKDQNGNKYYEVDHLVQDTVFEYVLNDNDVQNNIPYILYDKKVPHRFIRKQFVSETDEKVYSKLVFGNLSESDYQQRLFNANPNDLVLPAGLQGINNNSAAINQLTNRSFDPENMLLVDSLGIGPTNGDVLTIKYITGDGSAVRINSGKLTRFRNVTWSWNDDTQAADVIASLTVNNDEPSAGGREPLSTEELKHYATSYGLNQKRAVTPTDYAGVILSMPEYLGRPDQVFATRSLSDQDPFRIEVFMLSIDGDGHYFDPTKNPAFVHNMRLYLKKYKALNDYVVLRSGKVLNVNLEFDIQVHRDFQINEVSFNALMRAKEYMSKSNWSFGKHFEVFDFISHISRVNGIVSVSNVRLARPDSRNLNSYPKNYSNQALEFNYKKNKYIVPEDSIIEVRYMDDDIRVNADTTS